MSDASTTLERAVARLVVQLQSAHLDAASRQAAKSLIKDQLAVQIGAARLPWSRQVRAARQLRPGRSTLVGEHRKVAAADATYLNATYGHGFEYDDFAGNGHPGCCVVPTALAVGEEVGASLEQMLVAMSAGYEVYVRIGRLGSPDLLNAGWQPHCVLANFGAAAVAAKLYGLNEDQTCHALGIALSHASGPTEYASTGGSVKRVHAGLAARNGVESAELARAGITGPLRWLTGRRGLYATFIRKSVGDEARAHFALDAPMTLPGLSFKAYCSCACTHPFIEAGAMLRRRAHEIASIDVKVQTMVDSIVGTKNENIYQPRNIEELQYSLPAQMALAVTGKGNGYRTHRDFLEGRLQLMPESDVIQLARKIKLQVSEELDQKYPMRFVADVTAHFKDGGMQRLFVDRVPGRNDLPYTPEQHLAKLNELTEEVIGREQSDRLFAMLDRFDPEVRVTDLTALLCPPRTPAAGAAEIPPERLQAMVQEIMDREAIRDCLMRYARGVDRFDRELILSVFHPDFIDEHGKFVGTREEFADWALDQHARTHLSTQHYLVNHRCDLDGDTAHTETYFMFVGMNRQGKPLQMNGGRYIDRFEKRDGVWAIAYRELLRDWANLDETPDMSDLTSFTSTRAFLSPEMKAFMQNGPASKRDRSDRSYARPLTGNSERAEEYRRLGGKR